VSKLEDRDEAARIGKRKLAELLDAN
jgi:hypothetical protein